MHKRSLLPLVAVFLIAGGLAYGAATFAVSRIEERSTRDIRTALAEADIDWADVTADGLRLQISGTAPDEAARFRALSVAGQVVDAGRVADDMDVSRADPIDPPKFSVEILRQSDEITLIGLIPAEIDRQSLMDRVGRAAFNTPIVDLLEQASYPSPAGWKDAVDYGLSTLGELDRAKISILADRVAVTSMAESEEDRARLEKRLRDTAPRDLELALDISAPRPVVSPYILRLVRTGEATRFDACTAPDETAAGAILAAAHEVGVAPDDTCRLGLGVPSPDWAEAATASISALGALEAGRATISDLAVRFEAGDGQTEEAFADAAGQLETALPEGFVLTAVGPDANAVEPELGPAEFSMTRSPEGLVRMTGRIASEQSRDVVTAFAQSLFGVDQVAARTEISSQVPQGWDPRVLVGLDVLSLMTHGAVTVTEGDVSVTGSSGSQAADDEVARLLTDRLGAAASYEIDIAYDKRADPTLGLPTPEQCVSRINAVLTERQVTFDPGSAVIDAQSSDSVDAIAEIVKTCENVAMEVGGFTDSQGREEMNQQLSQERAEALLAGLAARRVLISDLVAKGYGEANPIADNGTEEGREANRRLEFALLETADGADEDADDAAPQDAEAAEEDAAADDAPDAE